MKPKIRLLACLLVAETLGFSASVLASEGRVPIPFTSSATLPITIDKGGSYIVTRDLTTVSDTSIITVTTTDPVSLNLNGITLTQIGTTRSAIDVGLGANVVIRNGFIVGGRHCIESRAQSLRVESVDMRSPQLDGLNAYGTNAAASVIMRDSLVTNARHGVHLDSGWPPVNIFTMVRIEDNFVDKTARSAGYGIYGNHLPSGSIIARNVVLHANDGIWLTASTGVVIRDNTIRNGVAVGIRLGNGSSAAGGVAHRVERNSVHGCPNALVLDNVQQSTIIDNQLTSTGASNLTGLRLSYGSSANVLEGNYIAEFEGHGIYISSGSVNNTYSRNFVMNNRGNDSCSGTTRFTEMCDDNPEPGLNYSTGDNMMPPSQGLF